MHDRPNPAEYEVRSVALERAESEGNAVERAAAAPACRYHGTEPWTKDVEDEQNESEA